MRGSGSNSVGNKIRVKFDGGCLKQNKITFNQEKILNGYIVYAFNSNLNKFISTLKNCLFGAVKLTKKYCY